MKRVIVAALLATCATAAFAQPPAGLTKIPSEYCLPMAQLTVNAATMRDDGATRVQAKASVYVATQSAQFPRALQSLMLNIVDQTFDEEFAYTSADRLGSNVYASCQLMSK